MENTRTEALDRGGKTSIVIVDCAAAAAQLARGHLSGPSASVYLAQALAGAALLGAETSRAEETVTFRLDAPDSPLGGFLAEATAGATLRGYTRKKILADFDGLGVPKDCEVLGKTGTFEIIRSVPGSLISSGSVAVSFTGKKRYIAQGLDAYFSQSLQRRVKTALVSAAGDDGVPIVARGILAECPPDGDTAAFDDIARLFDSGEVDKAISGALVSPRTIFRKLGCPHAEIRKEVPVSFACRCSADRVRALLSSLSPEERKGLPPEIDVTCHMCGRTWSVPS